VFPGAWTVACGSTAEGLGVRERPGGRGVGRERRGVWGSPVCHQQVRLRGLGGVAPVGLAECEWFVTVTWE